MLTRLLDEILANGTARTDLLAQRMGTSEEMVKAMIDDLKRRGLLTEIDLNCGASCNGCQIANSCMPKQRSSRIWQLAHKPR